VIGDAQVLEDRLGAMPAGAGLLSLAERIPDVPELPQRLGLPAPVSDVPVDAQAPLVELDGGAAVPGTVVHLTEVREGQRLAQGVLDPVAYPEALLETVDRFVEAPLVAVGKAEDAERPAHGDQVSNLVKARQAPPQAVDRPFELTLFAVGDGLVDDGDALPMPVPQLGKDGPAALETGDGVIQAPGAQVGLADIVERDGFTAAIAVPPGGAEGQLVDRFHLMPVRPYQEEPVHHLGEADGEAGMGTGPCTA
jgi:hypothetical protein